MLNWKKTIYTHKYTELQNVYNCWIAKWLQICEINKKKILEVGKKSKIKMTIDITNKNSSSHFYTCKNSLIESFNFRVITKPWSRHHGYDGL